MSAWSLLRLTCAIEHFDWNDNSIASNSELSNLLDDLIPVEYVPERNPDDILSPHVTLGGFRNNIWDAPTAFSSMFDFEAEVGSEYYTNDFSPMPGMGDLEKMNFDAGQLSVLSEGQPGTTQGKSTMLTNTLPAIQANNLSASPPPIELHHNQNHTRNQQNHPTRDFPEGSSQISENKPSLK